MAAAIKAAKCRELPSADHASPEKSSNGDGSAAQASLQTLAS
jgi:hypothetical protein